MNVVYFSHSYRKEDAIIVKYFGRLMRSENLLPSLDPPSESVNAAKLERHLNNSNGMVAVVTRRKGGVSPHILFEINLCLKARKPLMVFIEDELSDRIIPARILQRRFSRKSFLRQVREHRHGLQILKAYLGEYPSPRYQPSTSRRACLLVGFEDPARIAKDLIPRTVKARGYKPIDISHVRRSSPESLKIYEAIACVDLAVCLVDSTSPVSQFLMGAIQASFIPSINITTNTSYKFNSRVPIEYQPRVVKPKDSALIRRMVNTEFDIFEEDFLELGNQNEVEKYATLLVDVASPRGAYEPDTRTYFMEVIMGDQYKTGQAGAVGPNAHAHDMTFNQVWNEMQGKVDIAQLAGELSTLRQAMKQEATEVDHDIAVSDVAKAEQAAKAGDGPKVVEHLKSAGKWALDIATKIGTSLAVEAIKEATGLKHS